MIRDTYRTFGVADDDLSSFVYVYTPQPGVPVVPGVYTLRQVEAMDGVPECSGLYVVENPAVFSTLLDLTAEWQMSGEASVANRRPMLICTSGPASAAALRFIDRICALPSFDYRLRYSGDFDIRGLEIGHVLANRYSERFTAWHFDVSAYRRFANIENEDTCFDVDELDRLRRVAIMWDPHLVAEMSERGQKLFQEQFVAALAADWLRALGGDTA